MKAITLRSYRYPDNIELTQLPAPVPTGDQVLLKVHATSINDWDWGLVRGKPFYIRLLCGFLKPKVQIPGAEVAGVVEAVGDKVQKLKVGDRVYGDISESGFGGFAEYAAIPERALAPMPDSMSFDHAAALPHAATLAIQGLLDQGKLEPGQKLLVNGAGGGVGVLAVLIAKHHGVDSVDGVDHADKHEMLKAVGFQKTIDYHREDFTNAPEKYHLILDTKTNRSTFKYLKALKPGGTYVTVGGTTLRLIQALIVGPLIRLFTKKQIKIVALKTNRDLAFINNLYETGAIRPCIDGPLTLDQVPEALRNFGNATHKGKIVISLAD